MSLQDLASKPKPVPVEAKSVGGFVENLGEDAWELVKGLGQVGVGALVDVFTNPVGTASDIVTNLVPEALTLGRFSSGDDYRTGTGRLLSQLPAAVASDYARRYGGVSNITEGLYEDPLAYLLDALAIGSLGTTAAAKVASGAVKGSEAAALAAKEVGQELVEAGVKPRTALAAAQRAGLGALDRPLTATEALAERILPAPTKTLVGSKLVPTAQPYNPLTRAAVGLAARRFTEPLSALEQRVGALQGEIAAASQLGHKVPEELVAEYGLRSSILKEAQEAGLSRITKPGMSETMANVAARKLLASTNARFMKARQRAMSEYERTLAPLVREAPELAEEGSAWMTGVNISVAGSEPADWFVKQQARAAVPLETRVAAPTAPAPLRTALSDAGQAALEGGNPLAQRTEAVVAKLRAYKDRLADPNDLVHHRVGSADLEADAVDRLIDHLYVGLDRQLLGADTPAAVRMVESSRLLDMEKMVDEFDSLASTPRQVLEETYAPLRLKYGATWDETGSVLEGGPGLEALDDAIRASGESAPTYFPFIDPEKARVSDYFTSKARVGANIFARDPHAKRMRGITLMEGSYIRNPVEALTRRAARGVRANETFRQMAEVVQTFGRPISRTDDVPPGFVVVAPDLLFLAKRTGFRLEDTLDDLLSRGIDRDGALAQALETVTMKNVEDVAALLESGNVKMWAVPKVVADRLSDAARAAGFLSGKGRLWYDTVIAGWRGLVLSGSPRWVVNNFLGNTMFAVMQGTKTADVMRALAGTFKEQVLKRESAFLRELRKLPGYEDVPSGFVGSSVAQYEAAKPALAGSRAYQLLRRTGQTKPATWARTYGRGMQTLNAIIEDAFRSASYVTAAERQLGMSAVRRTGRSFLSAQRRIGTVMERGFDEAAAKGALAEVTRFFGDYAALGPFERHVVRRWIVPFWGFYKHQGRLLLSFPFEYPARAAVLRQFAELNNEMVAEYGPMPEWLEGALPLGPSKFLSSRGANPFMGSFQSWTSMLSPVLRVAFEQGTGRSLLTGEPFSDANIETGVFGSDQRFRVVRDSAGNVIDVKPVEKVTPSIVEHLLQQIPQYELAKDVLAGGKTYDTATLLDAIQEALGQTGEAAIIDQATGQPRFPTDLAQQLAKFAGVNVYDYDLAAWQQRQAEEKLAALRQALGL